MSNKIQLIGIEESNARINALIIEAVKSVSDVMERIGLDLAGKAATKAPVRTGDLRGSWFAVTNKGNLLNQDADNNPESARLGIPAVGKYEVIVGFSEPYAEKQHETLTFRHELGGEPKFLENPFKEMSKRYIDDIKESFKKAVE